MRRRRAPLLGAALVIGGSRAVARGEMQRQAARQETAMNTQARLQWEAQQSAARDQQIASDAAKAALAEYEAKQAAQPNSRQADNGKQTQGPGNARFCHNCGHQLSENARFCHECGTRVNVPINPQVIAPPNVDPPATS